MSRARRLAALLLSSLVFAPAALPAATLFDPALRFRKLPTEHFVIYFHQGEDRLAGRLAAIAEDTWTTLRRSFGRTPPLMTHVVLVDQWEAANGYATPLPRDTVVVSAAWPEGVDFIGVVDDWLRMVFTHEFTHIVHLDRSEGWARAVRAVLGRDGIAFPNLFLPQWQIEGLATYQESAVTGTGRLHAGDFRAVIREEARQNRMQPLDRVNGGLTDWPSGFGAYAYGLDFHQYLADRFGPESLGRLGDATARRLPYLASGAFRKVYGQSLGALWRDFEATVRATTPPAGEPDARITRLTHHAFIVSGPRFDRFDRSSIVYSVRTPHGFPAMNRVRMDGRPPRHVVRRYFGSTSALGADTIYFDQEEIRRNVANYSDLYALSRTNHRVRRLTSEARLHDPDLSPDGTTLACVQQKPGQRDLVLVRLKPDVPDANPPSHGASGVSRTSAIVTLISEPDTQFNAPRWSPDGRTIAVERHRPGELSKVVLVDVASKTIRELAWGAPARMVTPAWRPDGRALLVAVAPEEQVFNLYEYNVDAPSAPTQITRTTGGATWPDVSPDGRTIVFAGYTADGFDLFTMPYSVDARTADRSAEASRSTPVVDRAEKVDREALRLARPEPVEGRARSRQALAERVASAKPYSPFPTLWPTSWTPVYESDGDQVRLGAAFFGSDVLGYHFYTAAATWLTSGPDAAPTPNASTPDWSVYYAYGRWRPVFWISGESSTSFFAGPASDTGEPLPVTRRRRQLEGGLRFPITHARVSHLGVVSLLRSRDDFTALDGSASRDRAAVRGGWSTATARLYGYSISPEAGIRIGATAEAVRRSLGSTNDATSVTGDLRLFAPLPAAHHVLAVRLAGGASTGEASTRRNFLLGGAGPNPAVIDFGSDAISLLRGFPANRFAGSHVALLNADYRFPIARPQRGVGTWPLFLHTLHGVAFVDAGHAWTTRFDADAIKTAVGGELGVNLVAGFFGPITISAGAAWGHDGSGTAPNGTTFYVRVGRSF